MDLQDKDKQKGILRSFGYALEGLRYVTRHEKNMQIHVWCAVIVLGTAILLRLPLVHCVIVLLVIAGMFALEMMNTAIERTVDLVTKDFHPLAKQAKDIAAGAVFIYSLFAIAIGLLLFIPPLVRLIL